MQPNDLAKIEGLLKYFNIESAQIHVEEEADVVKITVDMDEMEAGRLIGRFATTLDSLQLLISLMLNQGDFHRHILLDVADYRARRLETLMSMVERAKSEVEQTGEPSALPLLSATERRQIHLILKDDAVFTSFSEGNGPDRRLFIAPQNN
jgi:spoIIIJ-associated protein